MKKLISILFALVFSLFNILLAQNPSLPLSLYSSADTTKPILFYISGDGGFNKFSTSFMSGYDAYFGSYAVDEETGQVSHTILGSAIPANVGMTVLRNLRADENKLTIQLETTTTQGEPITRTLTWKRIS